ncbi:MAG: hypothetical protein R3F17_15490 [Planctomycetota bacterium]
MPQSDPVADKKRSAFFTSQVKIADESPYGTPLCNSMACSRSGSE